MMLFSNVREFFSERHKKDFPMMRVVMKSISNSIERHLIQNPIVICKVASSYHTTAYYVRVKRNKRVRIAMAFFS